MNNSLWNAIQQLANVGQRRWFARSLGIASLALAASGSHAWSQSREPFVAPEMTKPSVASELFSFTDVGAKIPNYTPGRQWGTQGAPLTSMQNPLPAEVSIQAYSVPQGFQLALWAKERSVNWPSAAKSPATAQNEVLAGLQGKPIAMNWDERGRLWLCETIDYPNELQPVGKGRDHIKICEDTDNDGQADKFTLFASHLSIPSTLVHYRGGVIVQDGQSTIYLKDTDGDDVADFKQQMITGWALGDTHGGVSNFQYGPDNWIWGMQGYNNSEPVINGKPQMRFRQGFWRFKVEPGPADSTAPAFAINKSTQEVSSEATNQFNDHTIRVPALEFIRATNNNTWGLGFSEEGFVFGSTANNCPSVHMPIASRYYDRVAGWSAKTLDKISPDAKFKAIDEGIRQVDVHGGYTAACGAALYTARNYPQTWWNRISLVCEPTGHLVGGFVLEKDGAGYKSNNLFNAVASIDDWAAPIMAEVGPDGNVWILDWYNYIVQHNPTPNGFKTGKGAAYESDLRDKRFARVYRLVYGATTTAPTASRTRSLSQADNGTLIEALRDTNFFWRRTAQRLLIERKAQDAKSLAALVALVESRDVDAIGLAPAAVHAIWTLAGLAETGDAPSRQALREACEQGFRHPSSAVRNAAVVSSQPEQLAKIIDLKLVHDADVRVRLSAMLRMADAAATTQTSLPGAQLVSLLKASPDTMTDEILLDAWVCAAATNPVESLVALLNDDTFKAEKLLADRVAIIAEHVARSNPTAEQVARLLDVNPDSMLTISALEGLGRGWPKSLVIALPADAQRKFRERFLSESTRIESQAAALAVADKWSIADLAQTRTRIQDRLFQVALSGESKDDERLIAWQQAIRISPTSPQILEAADKLLTPQLSPVLGDKALDALQAAAVDGLADKLLAARPRLGPSLASGVLRLLLGRSETTSLLLDKIETGTLQFSELQLDQRQALLNHPDRAIAKRAGELMKARGAALTSNRQGLVDEWMPVIEMKGDVENGIAVYKKHCAQCHKHGELGTAIGPNLTGMAVHPKPEILMNILDPSRSVESNFRTYQILTVDGVVKNGMLAGESANAVRIINTQGKEEQVLRSDIDQLVASPKSLMPEGFESSISKQEMADLLAYLSKRGRYTPLTLTAGATLSGAKGLPGFRGAPGDKFEFDKYGTVTIEGVPFELPDPQEGRVANIVALQSAGGRAATLPSSSSIACTGVVSSVHLLTALSSFGPPREGGTSLIVRCHFEDGTSEDHKLISGKHLATYRQRVEVPESKFAIDARGKQIRYLKLDVDGRKALKSIEFVKGDDFSTPLVFAVTVESAESAAH